ncbi:ATP-binding protein [Flavobacteriaceae bacterium F08102]|nr:ATP-binding protein [Flavobacteriaceae bacterium F08102]
MPQKIVITGGPSSGKTTLISALADEGHLCMPEISREITQKARNRGVEYLYLEDPVRFSQLLLEGRKKQFQAIINLQQDHVFFDRGIPDIIAYLEASNTTYPKSFWNISKEHRYDLIFILPPWKEIYTQDEERYEDFNLACTLYLALKKTYTDLGHHVVEIPIGTISERLKFIYNSLKN